MKLTVGHFSVPAAGEVANGDRPFFRESGKRRLLAVFDGLGHGPQAEAVSESAVELLESVSLDVPLADLMLQLHAALAGSRGAAAALCMFEGAEVEACAVGNVELRTLGDAIPLVASAGVLGVRVSKFRICHATIQRSTRLLLYSDGLPSRLHFEDFRSLGPQALCERVVLEHRREYDDSTLLAADLEPFS